MKKPRLLNLAAGVSPLLAVAIVALWVRSCGRREGIGHYWNTPTEHRFWVVDSMRSELDLLLTRVPERQRIAKSYLHWEVTQNVSTYRDASLWFPLPPLRVRHDVHPENGIDEKELEIAYWLLLLPTLPLPVIAIVRHRRRRQREMNNLCPTCGYDLRATPDRCPECGTAVPVAAPAAMKLP